MTLIYLINENMNYHMKNDATTQLFKKLIFNYKKT